MKIGIDIFQLVPGQGRGGGHYTYFNNLFCALIKEDRKNDYVLFANKDIVNEMRLREYPVDLVVQPMPPYRHLWIFRIIWMHTLLPIYVLRTDIDILFFPFDYGSLFSPVPSVVTIHDLIDLYYLKNYPSEGKKFRMMYSLVMKWFSVRTKDCIIAVSEATRKDILGNLCSDRKNIRVIHEGVNKQWFHANKLKTKEHPTYIFSVLSTSVHKNFMCILDAYRYLREKLGINIKFLMAGMGGQSHWRILDKINRHPYRSDIELLGYIEEDQLLKFMANAQVFVFVSKKEGFGLPILEAMAAGVPVITSSVSSMPEVASDAALLVDPEKVEQIAKAIYWVITDSNLRQKLIEKGYRRARKFRWEYTAKATVKAFEDCMRLSRRT